MKAPLFVAASRQSAAVFSTNRRRFPKRRSALVRHLACQQHEQSRHPFSHAARVANCHR